MSFHSKLINTLGRVQDSRSRTLGTAYMQQVKSQASRFKGRQGVKDASDQGVQG